jgi:hypothetical protein
MYVVFLCKLQSTRAMNYTLAFSFSDALHPVRRTLIVFYCFYDLLKHDMTPLVSAELKIVSSSWEELTIFNNVVRDEATTIIATMLLTCAYFDPRVLWLAAITPQIEGGKEDLFKETDLLNTFSASAARNTVIVKK